jgi:hypothetical protein
MLSGERRFKPCRVVPDQVAMAAEDARREIRWLSLDPDLRRRVSRAARRGEQVSDPHDSPIAVGYANASLEWLSYRGRLVPFYLLVAIALLLRVLVTGRWYLAQLVYPALGFGFVKLRTPVWSRRLAAGLQLPPARIGLAGRSWLVPGRRRRLLVIALGTALAFLLYVVVAATVLVETGR